MRLLLIEGDCAIARELLLRWQANDGLFDTLLVSARQMTRSTSLFLTSCCWIPNYLTVTVSRGSAERASDLSC